MQQWVWQQEHTVGSPPLGVYQCGFTVVGRKVVVYGGYCGHGDCWHNSLCELDMTTLRWTEMAPSEAEGAPLKKQSCGMVAHSSGGGVQLCVFGGYGLLKSSTHPPASVYAESTKYPGNGWTNEFHCFTSGELTQYTHHSVEYITNQCISNNLARSEC